MPAPRKAGANPIGMMTTVVSVPLFPLQHRCKACRLCRSHPALFDELTRRLLEAQERKAVIAWLKREGVSLDEKCLSRHYQRHMLPYFQSALEIERRLEAEQKVLGTEGAVNIASVIARTLAMRVLDIIETIPLENMAKGADANFLREINRLAGTIAQIDAQASDSRLKDKLLELRTLEVAQKTGRLEELAARWLMTQLKDRPDLAKHIIDELDLPQPMKQLPSPKPTGKANHSTSRKRSRSSSPTSARRKLRS